MSWDEVDVVTCPEERVGKEHSTRGALRTAQKNCNLQKGCILTNA